MNVKLWLFLSMFLFTTGFSQKSKTNKGVMNNKRLYALIKKIDKIKSQATLSVEERNALTYLLQSIKRSPENINYLIISIFSLVAIITEQIINHFFMG